MEQQKEVQIVDKVFDALKKMPYYRNFAATSGAVHNIAKQEDAVKEIFIQLGLTEFQKPKGATKNIIKSWINNPSLAKMSDMTFIVQPCGTQDNPDYIVKINDKIVFGLECKSSDKKTKSPMYNSGGITQNYIYVYSSEATNETTIYLGKDIISLEQQKLIDEHILAVRKMDEELNKKLKALDTNNRGVCYYTRPMICQAGGALITDYFKHEKRKQCEENVVLFVKEMISR